MPKAKDEASELMARTSELEEERELRKAEREARKLERERKAHREFRERLVAPVFLFITIITCVILWLIR